MFNFLGLPREIRDEIYKLCLVREKIEFEEFYTDETPEEWMKDRRPDSLTLHIAKPGETPLLEYQGVSFVHRVESLTPIDGRSRWDDIYDGDRQRSYRICRHTTNPPSLGIFYTNRLVYQEASVTFYGKNLFSFPSKDCETTLNACSAFLGDRPEQAVRYTKNISFAIGYIHGFDRRIASRRDYIHRGAHFPTLKRLVHAFRPTLSLDQLNFAVEEQSPSEKALQSWRTSADYVSAANWYPEFEQMNVPRKLEILFIDSDPPSSAKQSLMNSLVYYVTRDRIYPYGRSSFSIEIPKRVNYKGKTMTALQLLWPRVEVESSKIAEAKDC